MVGLSAFILLIATLLIVFYFRLDSKIGLSLVGAVILGEWILHLISFTTFLIAALLFVSVAFFLLATSFRQQKIIQPLNSRLRAKMPTISATEKDALEAGNTWWEKSLFSGNPNWSTLFGMAKPTLTVEEESFLNNQVEQLCQLLDDWQIVHQKADLTPEVWEFLKKEKFFGMVIAKEYGGLGFSALAHSTIVTKIATRSISAAVNTMVPNSLGPGELLTHYGTEAQKNYYLPRLAKGEEIPCFGLTATDAGSDASAIPDIGIIEKGMHEGKEVIGIRLNFEKRYITLAPVATVIGIAFRLYDPNELIGKQHSIGLTLCLIPASHPGIEIGNRHYPLHLAFMNGPVRGKDVFIPIDWIIGGIDKAGKGWRMLMECLSIGRSISLPALATACTKVAYQQTGAYARIRRQFNMPISQFEGIEEVLAEIAGITYLLEATRIFTASAVDQHIKPSIASAIAKYHMTELARSVINHAMDVHAGHAIQIGPKNELANLYFALPISITVEGANILTRNLIIFGQGAIRCHPYLLQEVELLSSPVAKIPELDQLLLSHLGYSFHLIAANILYSLTGGIFISSTLQNSKVRKLHKQITRMSAALAMLSDMSLMLLGGSLKRKERVSARLGDILSYLYLASATLKYYHDNNYEADDVDYVCWCLQFCLAKIQDAIVSLLNNYPNRMVAFLLKMLVFPFGLSYAKPNDVLDHVLVKQMTVQSPLRERLLKQLNINHGSIPLRASMETALKELNEIEPLLKKLQKVKQINAGKEPIFFSVQDKINAAIKQSLLTEEEASRLLNYESLRRNIIDVNEFSFDLQEVVS